MAHGAHEKEHPLAGFVFLALVGVLLFFAARAGIGASKSAMLEKERRAIVELGLQNPAEAEKLAEAMHAAHPNDSKAAFLLGVLRVRSGRLDEADKLFVRAQELDPTLWDATSERAEIAKRKGDIAGALALLEKIPVGQGHLRERMRDGVWWDLRGDERLKPIFDKHKISSDSSLHKRSNVEP